MSDQGGLRRRPVRTHNMTLRKYFSLAKVSEPAVSSAVLKTSRVGDCPAEFNSVDL